MEAAGRASSTAHQSHTTSGPSKRVPTPDQLGAIIASAAELIAAIEKAPWVAGAYIAPDAVPLFLANRTFKAIREFERIRNPQALPYARRANWSGATTGWSNDADLSDGIRRLFAAHDRIIVSWKIELICECTDPDASLACPPGWPPKIDPAELQELKQSLAIMVCVRDSEMNPVKAEAFTQQLIDAIVSRVALAAPATALPTMPATGANAGEHGMVGLSPTARERLTTVAELAKGDPTMSIGEMAKQSNTDPKTLKRMRERHPALRTNWTPRDRRKRGRTVSLDAMSEEAASAQARNRI
jgi:hypothetical protein